MQARLFDIGRFFNQFRPLCVGLTGLATPLAVVPRSCARALPAPAPRPTEAPAGDSAGAASPAHPADPDHHPRKHEGGGTMKPRDQRVLDFLIAHRVATPVQLARWAPFTSGRQARESLKALKERDILARFRPYRRPGSAPFHYIVGREGAAIHADRTGAPTPRPREITDAQRRLEHSPNLAHLVGVVEFFTRLYAAGRATSDGALAVWWSENDTADKCDGIVRPDGYGEWVAHTHTHSAPSAAPRVVGFFYEHDRGTESLETVLGKLDRYAALARERGKRRPVLVELPTPAREDNLHEELTRRHGQRGHPTVYVATTNTHLWTSAAHGPARAVWRPAGTTGPRWRLDDLPAIPHLAQVPS